MRLFRRYVLEFGVFPTLVCIFSADITYSSTHRVLDGKVQTVSSMESRY